MSEQKPLLVLVDGSSYLFRAYHALPPLTNSKGEATGALVGVINMLRKLIADYQPSNIGVVFDAPGKTFRNDLYAEYKANRPPMPDDLREQIKPLHEIIRAMGLPVIIESGVEADDVIGTLAAEATRDGVETVISTSDKDLAQLVSDHVTLVNTMSETKSDRQGVIDKFGVAPEQIIDYLALVGDTSDNIPGVPKCGPKTAAKWLSEFGDIDNLLANADSIKGKIGESLRASMEQIPLSRELTTIKTDVKLHESIPDLVATPADTQKLREWYRHIESNRLLATLDEEAGVADAETPEAEAPAELKYETILTQDDFERWLEKLSSAELICIDTETTSLDYMQAEIVGLSFSVEAGEACYIPVAHNYPGAPDQLDREMVLTTLKPLLEDANIAKVGQHLKYDMNILANAGINLQGVAYDTMLESYVFNSTATRHDMDSLAQTYLNLKTIKYEEVAGKGAKQLTFDQVPLEQAAPYAAEDADITLRLHQAIWPKLSAESGPKSVFETIEIPLVPVLSRIECTGVRIDSAMLVKQSGELATRMHKLEEQAYEIAGRSFNMGSPKQIGQIFFEELELPVISKTPKGAPSTAESVLQELAEQGHELPQVILSHRGLAKLRSTYTDKLPEMVDPDTGRVHTSYHQAVAATGRLSSSDPNLQNIPVRTEEGRRIRQAFVPEDGYRMVAADYSQVELRIMAHLSGDKALMGAFSDNMDVHRATAAEVFGVTLDEVTPDQRRSAKAINFGLIYGMSAFGLAKQLGVERSVAQEYVDLYFERYPGVREFMDSIRADAHQNGYVETVFGRRLYLPEINSRNGMRRAASERTAINAPMQGTAADIIKLAMLDVDGWIRNDKPDVRMIMQVHDELVFEVAEGQLDSAVEQISSRMSQAAELKVPLVVDVGIGDNWDEAH
ncbi:DNA polymerase I [Solemya velum gill symbiont]|uniref:DNA polymerase I n=1 Tax=Solemya velum gill symbiont TaxID=2340 RepID=A0A0B0HB92_SOVGS|nr:DNA polymerase I [Solemya velum gill symbiont]KHF26335.1 DNA polymerase I [Solemya velum gill symbiont]